MLLSKNLFKKMKKARMNQKKNNKNRTKIVFQNQLTKKNQNSLIFLKIRIKSIRRTRLKFLF